MARPLRKAVAGDASASAGGQVIQGVDGDQTVIATESRKSSTSA